MRVLINEKSKVIVPKNTNLTEISYNGRTIILSAIEDDSRQFGGAFVKLALKADSYKRIWITSTIEEGEFKEFVAETYNLNIENLFRFY